MGGEGGQANQQTVTKTDSENTYETVNKVFDNAGNVYFQSPMPAAAMTPAQSATGGGMDRNTMIALGVAGVGAFLLWKKR